MTKQGTTISQAVLKNVDTASLNDAQGVMNMIGSIVNSSRRSGHLAGGVESIQWDRKRGIGVLVENDGQMIHLANALSLTDKMKPRKIFVEGRLVGTGYGRTGEFGGFTTTVWYVEI